MESSIVGITARTLSDTVRGVVFAVFMGTAAVASGADPNTWWVDASNYGAAGRDGSEANPFGTILEAISNPACVNGDTIKVNPGVYDKDYDERTVTVGNADWQMRSRVFINKKVNIVATGAKEDTHIVGRFCPVDEGGNATCHSGPTAVRCVYVTADGKGSTLTGFTLRDSATINYSNADVPYNCGGAIGVAGKAKNFYVTDCVISNCIARYWGGSAYGGTLNRCVVSDCRAGGSRGAAFYQTYAINSVIAHCRVLTSGYTSLSKGSEDRLVNCTIYGNKSATVDTANCFNCLFVGNGSVETNGTAVIASNVYASNGTGYSTASLFQLFAPALGDYHPLPGSAALGAGDPSKLSVVPLPSGMEVRDMDGNLIDANAGQIAAGAYQTPKTPAYGGVMLNGSVTVEGFETYGSNLFYAASWPMAVKVGLPSSVFRLSVSGEKTDGVHSRYAGSDGYAVVSLPYAAGTVQTNKLQTTIDYTRYVNADSGSDDNDGKTAAKAWKTLQKAIDFVDTGIRLVYVAEGDYCTGGGVGRGVTNRVNCSRTLWVRFVATGDRDKTIIRGAAAKNERDHANYPGCGPDAVRCVSVPQSNNSTLHGLSFVGFTFADGHTDVGQNSSNDMGGAGYGRPNTANRYDSLQFLDCVFTNCYAPAGGVAARAHFTRCSFIDCGSAADGFRNVGLSASVVERGKFGTCVLGSGTCAVGCSVADSNAIAPDASDVIALNCALGNVGTLPASAVTWGSTARSRFANARNGDLRPKADSPALDVTRRAYPSPEDDEWRDFTRCFVDFAADSIDGTPWKYSGAYPIAGAYMEWAPLALEFRLIVR